MPGSIDGNTNDTSPLYYTHIATNMKNYKNRVKSRSGNQTSTSLIQGASGTSLITQVATTSRVQSSTLNLKQSSATNDKWLTKVSFPKPTYRKARTSILLAAYLAKIPYSHDVTNGKLTRAPDWALSKDLMDNVTQHLQEKETKTKTKSKTARSKKNPLSRNRAASSIKVKTLNGNSVITDKKTGLVVSILENEIEKEICISFGGTTSGKGAGGLRQRSKANLSIVPKQWGANLKNTIKGEKPDCYQQAVDITEKIKDIIASGILNQKYTGYELKLTGHSLGGGMAQYAAAMNYEQDKPIKAICFSSAELGRDMRTQIAEHLESKGNGAKEKTLQNINHYHIIGDPVPKMHRLFGHLTNIGTTSSIPPAKYLPTEVLLGNTRIGRHDKFFEHFYHSIRSKILTELETGFENAGSLGKSDIS